MLNREVIEEHLRSLEDSVRRLRGYQYRSNLDLLADDEAMLAVERLFQIAIQNVIDICVHLVSALALGTPNDAPEAVQMVASGGIVSREFGQTLVSMIRFRNILVHLYTRVNREKVCEHLHTGLDDFDRFVGFIGEFIEKNPPNEATP